MRYFKLINAVGAEWDLMQRDGFFHAPSGLGYRRTLTTMPSDYSWLITDDVLDQKNPSGEMVFKTYAAYQRFVAFVSNDTPLYLMYRPIDRWYRCRCKVTRLEKGEMSSPSLLITPITFACLDTWHELVEAAQSTPDASGGKTYSYSYPYRYSDTSIASAAINNGSLQSPCKLHIFGYAENPLWELLQGGETILRGRVYATIPDGHKLVVNASPTEMEIAEYTRDNAFVRDLYAQSDFSTARFIYAPPGASTLSVTSASGGVEAVVEVERLAYSV